MIALIDGDVLLHQSVWDKTSLAECIEKLEELITHCQEQVFCDDYLIAVGGPNNFREILYPMYKRSSSREKARQNKSEFFNDLKEYLTGRVNVVLSYGCEADDLLRIWANQARKVNKEYIVCSIDKDLKCIVGKHYNLAKQTIEDIDEDWADNFYWKQILMGDSVDNIPGIEGIGPKKADKILEGKKDKEERKQAVIEAYKVAYNDEWYSYLLANGRLIHIWRYYDDHFKI